MFVLFTEIVFKNNSDAQFEAEKNHESVAVRFNADSVMGRKIMKRHTKITEENCRICN
jgi:hypothetical protein